MASLLDGVALDVDAAQSESEVSLSEDSDNEQMTRAVVLEEPAIEIDDALIFLAAVEPAQDELAEQVEEEKEPEVDEQTEQRICKGGKL